MLLHDHIAGCAMFLIVFLCRLDVRQEHDDDGNETDQCRQDDVPKDGAGRIVVVELIKFGPTLLPSR